MKNITLEQIGYTSWLELFSELVTDGLDKEDKILLEWKPEDETPSIEVPIALIRSNAFLELYDQLPLKGTVDLVGEIVQSAESLIGKKYTQPVLEFLTKIPLKNDHFFRYRDDGAAKGLESADDAN